MSDDLTLPQVPEARPADPEDVSWALSTAEAMWARGEHADGIKWVRRAAEAASEAEQDQRALELAKAAADLAGLIARRSSQESVRLDESDLVSDDRMTVVGPALDGSPQDLTSTMQSFARTENKAPARPENNAGPARRDSKAIAVPLVPAPARPDRKAVPSAPSPSASPPTTVAANRAAAEPAARNSPSDPGIQTSQAVRVVVWRDANGVHVAPAGTVVSAITVDAVLVALEPKADLTAWLGATGGARDAGRDKSRR